MRTRLKFGYLGNLAVSNWTSHLLPGFSKSPPSRTNFSVRLGAGVHQSGNYRSICYMEILEMRTGNFGRMDCAQKFHEHVKTTNNLSEGIAVLFRVFENFPFHHHMSGQCFDPGCSSPNNFNSSTNKTVASMPESSWTLCWFYHRLTNLCLCCRPVLAVY